MTALYVVVALLLMAVDPRPVIAQTLGAPQREALDYIKDYAGSVCQRPELKGRSTTLEGNATLKAGFNVLVGKLIKLDPEIGGQAQRVTWEGIAQAGLGEAFASANNCIASVIQVLVPLIPPAAPRDKSERPPYVVVSPILSGPNSPIVLFGTYNTAEECAAPNLGGLVANVCRPLPEEMPCHYSKTTAIELLLCYWTPEACEVAYAEDAKTPQSGGVIVPCEKIGWADALMRSRAIDERSGLRLFRP